MLQAVCTEYARLGAAVALSADESEVDRFVLPPYFVVYLAYETPLYARVRGHMSTTTLYETDFHAWTWKTAEQLRAGELAEVDVEHLAEELEDMGRSTQRALHSRLALLLSQPLKWQFQPGKRSRSWQATIRVQRRSVVRLLRLNPSLRAQLADFISEAYEDALDMVWSETGLEQERFPLTSPYTEEQLLDEDFLP